MNHLIACPIFKEELEAILPSNTNLSIHYMDRLIHNDAKKMLQELETATSSAPESNIGLLVGRECFCEISISDFANKINANLIDEKNCIEAILGLEKTERLQENRTTIHTRGWMEMITQSIKNDPINGDSIRIMLGHYEKLILLDYGIKPYTDEEILSYYDLLEVPIEIESVHLKHFEKVLKKLFENHVTRECGRSQEAISSVLPLVDGPSAQPLCVVL
ncbi:MAG: hypothetical protein ACI8PB_001195 [Desulforhopalus sp.]|jgi:hypothetical protein